ncbi:MAG: hypothetical protein IPN67_21305 [Bacteroidales bacterium]|nr:hypothetical protein [Bacteroidales bacterium]
MKKSSGNIGIIISTLRSMIRNRNFSKIMLALSFWMVIAASAAGQCFTSVSISFNQNTGSLVFDDNLEISICGDIGPSQNDIDIWNTTSSGNPSPHR